MIYQGGVQGFPRASHAPILGSELLHSPMECPLSGLQPPHLQGTGAAVRDPYVGSPPQFDALRKVYSITLSARETRSAVLEADCLGGPQVDD